MTVHSSSFSSHEQVDLQRATLVKLDSNGAVPKPFACSCPCPRFLLASPIWHWLCRLAALPRRLTGILPNSPIRWTIQVSTTHQHRRKTKKKTKNLRITFSPMLIFEYSSAIFMSRLTKPQWPSCQRNPSMKTFLVLMRRGKPSEAQTGESFTMSCVRSKSALEAGSSPSVRRQGQNFQRDTVVSQIAKENYCFLPQQLVHAPRSPRWLLACLGPTFGATAS